MKLKNTLFLAVIVIGAFTAHAQKEILLFTASSKKSTRPLPRGVVISAMALKLSRILPHDVVSTVDDGVVILAGDELYKYNADYQLVFKSNLANLLKFPKLSSWTSIVSDEKATYILEIKGRSKEKASVIQISPKGESRQQSYEIDINENMDYTPFIVNGKLCVLGKDIDKSKNKVTYKYYYINPADNKVISKVIGLPADDYEYDQIKKAAPGDFYWRYLSNHGDNVILYKAYFKKIPGSKKYTLICQMAEVDMQGNVSEQKSINFEPKLAGDDREFISPSIIFNKPDASVFFTGFMEIDRSTINGLYLLKYDYVTAGLIYNKEFAFKDLMKPEIKKKSRVHYAIPEKIDQYYPLVIRRDDILVDNINNFVNLRIITGNGMNSTTFFEVSFDKYGDHIKTVVTDYPAFINYYDYYVVNPTGYQSVWTDKTRPHVASAKMSPWDYIYGKVQEKKSDIFWIPVSTPKGNSVIRYDSEEQKFTAVVLK